MKIKSNNMKIPKTVMIYHLGAWYKASKESAKILSFITGYKLFENPLNGLPTVGFPESSINKVTRLLKANKINYILPHDENKLIDFGEKNNFDRFLFNDLPYSYVRNDEIITNKISGSFIVCYENETPIKLTIDKDIDVNAELVKQVVNNDVGQTIKINEYNIKIIEKNIN